MNEEVMFATEEKMAELGILEDVTDSTEYEKFLVFMTDDLKLGVDADYVVEIITDHNITCLPMLPDFIRGIINLRGEMIPIIDIRVRLGKPERKDALVIVLSVDDTKMGILVDSVDQMIDVPKSDLLPVPAQSVQQLVSGMCMLPDGSGTMMVLDCAQLLQHD